MISRSTSIPKNWLGNNSMRSVIIIRINVRRLKRRNRLNNDDRGAFFFYLLTYTCRVSSDDVVSTEGREINEFELVAVLVAGVVVIVSLFDARLGIVA